MSSFKQFLAIKKPILSRANAFNVVFWAVLLVVIFNPSAKALLIRGMMRVGLFQPKIPQTVNTDHALQGLPDIAFQNKEGKVVHLNELKGKVVFISFWATWCPPCIAEMPAINDLYSKVKNDQNVVFIMADVDNNLQLSGQFMIKHQLSIPLYQPAGAMPTILFSGTLPTTVIIDKEGQPVFHHEGAADYSNPKVLAYLVKLSK